MAWLRSDSKAILAIHTHMVTNNPRMGVEHNGHNSWTLRISNVMRNDSGIYMCQINTEPMTSQVSAFEMRRFLQIARTPHCTVRSERQSGPAQWPIARDREKSLLRHAERIPRIVLHL